MKKRTQFLYLVASLCVFLPSCHPAEKDETSQPTGYRAPIKELSDEEYPDNPDISIRHALDGSFSHSEVLIERDSSNGLFSLYFLPANEKSDTIVLDEVNLLEWMPTIPEHIKDDEYTAFVGVINQEWNRQQVKFPHEFELRGKHLEADTTVRVDLARNCLNSYLWEIMTYADNGSNKAPVYHGWFDFPHELYAKLFKERNGIPFEKYADHLEEWKTPESEELDLTQLREVLAEDSIAFGNHNDASYPLIGERKKKNKNIIRPKGATKIQDFLNDSTLFATFTPPGFYNTADPRKTKLGRLAKPIKLVHREVVSANEAKDTLVELEMLFTDNKGERSTKFIVGFELEKVPLLTDSTLHQGYQMPMGIANHSFYESYETAMRDKATDSPFYALLTDERGNWLDSHDIGIDGPLFFIKETEKGRELHLMILSFERHAFVGHYSIML